MIAPAESFFVTATQGPLAPGEIERARDWGELLGAAVLDQRRPAGRSSQIGGGDTMRD